MYVPCIFYDVYDTMYIIRCMCRGDMIMRYIQHLHTSSGQLGSSTYAVVVYVMARCTAQKTSKHVQNKSESSCHMQFIGWCLWICFCQRSDVFFSVLINDRRAYLIFFCFSVFEIFFLEKMSDMSDVYRCVRCLRRLTDINHQEITDWVTWWCGSGISGWEVLGAFR